ncbi:MAG: hypothetical protein IPP71_07875 [Bacteroidetes bacterium]|nr:hypothetical protein [Bacteroidota bacterium]
MNDLDFDANNNKWVCFGNFGLGMYDGTGWTSYNTGNSGIPSDSVICLDFDNAGNSWIGTNDGAVFKSGTNWTVYNTSNSGLPSNSITAILSDGGSTWFGTRNGLVFYDGTNWSLYNTVNSGLSNDSITVIKKGNNNDIWLGTRNGVSNLIMATGLFSQRQILYSAVILQILKLIIMTKYGFPVVFFQRCNLLLQMEFILLKTVS